MAMAALGNGIIDTIFFEDHGIQVAYALTCAVGLFSHSSGCPFFVFFFFHFFLTPLFRSICSHVPLAAHFSFVFLFFHYFFFIFFFPPSSGLSVLTFLWLPRMLAQVPFFFIFPLFFFPSSASAAFKVWAAWVQRLLFWFADDRAKGSGLRNCSTLVWKTQKNGLVIQWGPFLCVRDYLFFALQSTRLFSVFWFSSSLIACFCLANSFFPFYSVYMFLSHILYVNVRKKKEKSLKMSEATKKENLRGNQILLKRDICKEVFF